MNKVIILGNDHINTLGVIRIFGENKIKPILFVISEDKKPAVSKSKYIEKCFIFSNEKEAIKKLNNFYKTENNKIAIVPTSDAAALCLDENYDALKEKYYIPNINKSENCICKYMDKFKQQELFEKNKIKGIKSQIINLNNLNNNIILSFPIILKPKVSAEGKKNDIKICNDKNEFSIAIKELIDLGYNETLAQEFIAYTSECDIQGFSFNGKTSIPGVIEKIRIWPAKRGSTTYGKVVPNDKYEKIVNGIKNIMKDINYTGIFDIDFFILKDEDDNEKIYMNEINFRNSAISYAYGNSYIAYYWYLSCANNSLIEAPCIKESYNFIDDQADLHNVIEKEISLFTYQKDKKNSKIILVKNINDKKPYFYMTKNKIKNNIKDILSIKRKK